MPTPSTPGNYKKHPLRGYGDLSDPSIPSVRLGDWDRIGSDRIDGVTGSIGAHKSHLVSAKLYTARHLGYTFSPAKSRGEPARAVDRSF